MCMFIKSRSKQRASMSKECVHTHTYTHTHTQHNAFSHAETYCCLQNV